MRRLTLLQQFSLVSLALFIVIGAVLGWNLTRYFERQVIEQQKLIVSSLVTPAVADHITDEVLQRGAAPGSEDYRQIENALSLLSGSGLVRLKIWNREGMVVYSDEHDLVGRRFPMNEDLVKAYTGETSAEFSHLGRAENIEEQGFGELLEIYTPIWASGGTYIKAVFEGYYDVTDLRQQIDVTNGFLWTTVATGFAFLYISLFTIVRNASQRLLYQARENATLLADTRRKAARLQVVNELARSINSSSLGLSRVFEVALRGIDRIVDHTGASITLDPVVWSTLMASLPQSANGRPRVYYHAPGNRQPHRPRPEIPYEVQVDLLGQEDTFLCRDTRVSDQEALRAVAGQGVLSLLLVFIRLGERKLGVMCVTGDKVDAFNQEDAAILKGVADQLAVAIENSRLIREAAETAALREASRLKDEFVSMISHELRTPLTSIKGYSRTLLAEDATWDEQTRREFLTIISEESDKLAELVENLLEMSRIEAGRLPITREPMLLWRFCTEVVERIAKHYPHIKFECSVNSELPLVEADPRRVEQVLVNLLHNAAKYSRAETVRVAASYGGGAEVMVSVEDNGIGIPQEHLPRIFDKFYRVERDQGDAATGTGLGLAIVKALVEAQGGRIWVHSKVGEGTTFYFTLPALMMGDEGGEQAYQGRYEKEDSVQKSNA
jgi:signal transduction histidine kinase